MIGVTSALPCGLPLPDPCPRGQMYRKCFAAALQLGQSICVGFRQFPGSPSQPALPTSRPRQLSIASPFADLEQAGLGQRGWGVAGGVGLWQSVLGTTASLPCAPRGCSCGQVVHGVLPQCPDGAPQELKTDGQPSVPTCCRCLLGL